MKKAFTLVELLIVVVVLVTLMSMVFRLSTIAQSSDQRNTTVMKLQRIENCISGYYAAFGSYPPVKLCGSRNIYYKVNIYGIQQVESPNGKDESVLDWNRVEAACRSQPLRMTFPYDELNGKYIEAVSDTLMEMYADGEISDKRFANRTSNLEPQWFKKNKRRNPKWENCQVFQFGLFSFLLPRYILMMGHQDSSLYEDFAQWTMNNDKPCRLEDGAPYKSWQALNDKIKRQSSGERNPDLWEVEALPSQAVTARWMPNLEGILFFGNYTDAGKIYGINVAENNQPAFTVENYFAAMIFTGGDSQAGENSGDGSTQYVLNYVSCYDGWGHEFYYYSDPPYQSYRLWSAGPNGATFPPWISEEEIDRDSTLRSHRTTIQNWRSDDIVHMSH